MTVSEKWIRNAVALISRIYVDVKVVNNYNWTEISGRKKRKKKQDMWSCFFSLFFFFSLSRIFPGTTDQESH